MMSNKFCENCEHYHFHTDIMPDEVYSMTVREYQNYVDKIPCMHCMYNDWEDNYKQAIKPCPFCGSTAEVFEDSYDDTYEAYYTVECTKCESSSGMFKSRQDAIDNWNNRV